MDDSPRTVSQLYFMPVFLKQMYHIVHSLEHQWVNFKMYPLAPASNPPPRQSAALCIPLINSIMYKFQMVGLFVVETHMRKFMQKGVAKQA